MRKLLLFGLLLGLSSAQEPREVVYASFYPLAYFAEVIAADEFDVHCLVPGGEDPAFWKPTREDALQLQEAPLVLVHGASFERWVGYTSLPLASTVFAASFFREQLLEYDEGATHSHGKDGPPAHRGIDAHTWLEPSLARAEADVVLQALQRLKPERAGVYAERHVQLLLAFESWEKAVASVTEALGDELLIANHPAYEYLAHFHGWRIENIELDPDAPIDEEARARLSAAKRAGARIVLWEGAPSPEAERALTELGLRSLVFSPCETLSTEHQAAGEDFVSVMLGNLERLRAALQ